MVVWGTGNVGRPALRAVVAHAELALVGVVVSNPAKRGKDVGELCGLAADRCARRRLLRRGRAPPAPMRWSTRRPVTSDRAKRSTMSRQCLRAGANVVTTSIYPLLHRDSAPAPVRERFEAACRVGGASIFVSGIDPGWAQDVLPLLLAGTCAEIEQIRVQEIFNYATYHAPDAVRELVGLGRPMDSPPPMLLPSVPTLIWGGMLRTLASELDAGPLEIREEVETRPLPRSIEVPGMGVFDEGTLGAFRFEVQGWARGRAVFVIEHVTRIADDLAPEWPAASEQGVHRVIIEGRPRLEVTLVARDGSANPAEGGNATAAGRIVNAIPRVCALEPGIASALDVWPCGRGSCVSGGPGPGSARTAPASIRLAARAAALAMQTCHARVASSPGSRLRGSMGATGGLHGRASSVGDGRTASRTSAWCAATR